MSVKTCAHVFDNGTVCKSPALGDYKHCYFHIRLHQKPQKRKDGSTFLLLNDLTCVEGIQIAISNVLHATNDGLIDSRTANSLYRGLGMALSALRLKLAQQKLEASKNRDDSNSHSYRRDPLSQIMSLLDTASSSADGSRSPSSDTGVKGESGEQMVVSVNEKGGEQNVILRGGEAAAQDLCTSADTTQPDGAPYLPSVGRCGVPTAPADHPTLSSYEHELNSLTPDELRYAAGFMGLLEWSNEAVLEFLHKLYEESGPNPELLKDFVRAPQRLPPMAALLSRSTPITASSEILRIQTTSSTSRPAKHAPSASPNNCLAGVYGGHPETFGPN